MLHPQKSLGRLGVSGFRFASLTLAATSLMLVAGCQSPHAKQPMSQVPPPAPMSRDSGYSGRSAGGNRGNSGMYDAGPVEPQPMGNSGNSDASPPAELNLNSQDTGGGAMTSGGERSYTIRKGDTLWSIAQQEYGDGQRWQDILAANPGLQSQKMPVGKTITLPQ